MEKSALFTLFTLREPSSRALFECRQRMEKRQASNTPIGIPTVSSAKLPAHVPKVNSKWDGLPTFKKESFESAKPEEHPLSIA
ncbi:MAG: hypothetical protein GOMPHAMPRED_002179 [Gomphillus americanus]|uniref:Uncharacterized protein n=1 Tax=Gomphillus americanus TaxID=1940652 RepID=A0A8H3FFG2_9LECA|nr:MAG: hypothetical protein GOMPHAMPRED_002179 [Gomphillus americanus]